MKTEQKRWFIELSYNGSAFSGWQRQLNASSVQQTIEEAISLIFQKPTEILGCGRTDSGVHAKSFFAHFDTEMSFEPVDLIFKLNSILNNDIGISRICSVDNELHARFDATLRTYKYFVLFEKNPFEIPFSHYIYGTKPDIEKMNLAAQLLLGEHDFSCFEKIGSDNSTSICKISHAKWTKNESGTVFEISANRFLRNMVRAITGTLLEVGLDDISMEKFKTILKSKDRSQAGPSAPAKGLFLWEITYPNLKSYE